MNGGRVGQSAAICKNQGGNGLVSAVGGLDYGGGAFDLFNIDLGIRDSDVIQLTLEAFAIAAPGGAVHGYGRGAHGHNVTNGRRRRSLKRLYGGIMERQSRILWNHVRRLRSASIPGWQGHSEPFQNRGQNMKDVENRRVRLCSPLLPRPRVYIG